MMRQRAGCLMAMAIYLTATLAPHSAEARRLWPMYGARGDAQSSIECPDGEALVGFNGRTGKNINQVQIICARLLHDGSFGSPRNHGDPIGGTGGGPQNPETCPQNARMHELTVVLNPDGKQIEALHFACMDRGGTVTSRSFGAVERAFCRPTDRLHSCPQEQFVGIGVAFGRHVNAVGAICDGVTPAAAPPPRPKPIGRTGRAPAPGPVLAPRSAIGGKWRTQTSSNADFDVILNPQGDGMTTQFGGLNETEIRVTGQFINLQDAHDYDGTLQGTIPANSRTLIYTYVQKNGATGSGTFTLSTDGNSLTGGGTTSDGQKFTWNGNRAP